MGLDLLGDALFDARESREFTQHELAFRTGVSQSTISGLEHGLAPGVSLRRLGALIVVFGGIQFGPRPMTRDELADLFGLERTSQPGCDLPSTEDSME